MALDLKPNDPTILSNLGMSYVLGGDLRTWGLSQVRLAAARRRQSGAAEHGAGGRPARRFAKRNRLPRQELDPQQADANVAYLRSMMNQQNSWKQLAAKDGKTDKNTN